MKASPLARNILETTTQSRTRREPRLPMHGHVGGPVRLDAVAHQRQQMLLSTHFTALHPHREVYVWDVLTSDSSPYPAFVYPALTLRGYARFKFLVKELLRQLMRHSVRRWNSLRLAVMGYTHCKVLAQET